MSELRGLSLTLLIDHENGTNKKAQLENFADDYNALVVWLKKIRFL